MKFVKEAAIIFGITLAGELLNRLLPLPVPAGVYGLFILLFCLCVKVVKLDDVAVTGDFLLDIMPILFIPAGVGLITSASQIKELLLPLLAAVTLSTVFVMAVTGLSAQYIIRKGRKKNE